MYTKECLMVANKQLSKRRLIVFIPVIIGIIASILYFVVGQIERSQNSWWIATIIFILSGAVFIFFFSTYVLPMQQYRNHIREMQQCKAKETNGVYKSFSTQISHKDGLDYYALKINVGEKDDAEDDRLFYYDCLLPKITIEFGKNVLVKSYENKVIEIKEI